MGGPRPPMTYAAPPGPTTYAAGPTTHAARPTTYLDGTAMSMPQVMMTAAPMTYAAPASTMAYAAPMTYAAPPQPRAVHMQPQLRTTQIQPQRQMVPNLLVGGVLVQEQAIGRDQLIQSGHLIPNPEAEDHLMRQGMSIPGALQGPHMIAAAPSPHMITHPSTQPAAVHYAGGQSGHASQPQPVQTEQAVHMEYGAPPPQPEHIVEATGHPATLGAEALAVSILQANELNHLNRFTGDNFWVECEVLHKGAGIFSHVPKCTTSYADKKLSPDAMNPVWNEEHRIDGYYPGDQLQFTVKDHGFLGSKSSGVCHLDSEHFYPNGWEGEINVEHDNATISVRIQPLGVLEGH